MTLFYGWVIVGVGMIATCAGFGTMLSLGVFLQPLSEAMAWSRTEISAAALLNFLCLGVGSILWGMFSDRFGIRNIVILSGGLLGLGAVLASRSETILEFQVCFGAFVGFGAAGLFVPLTATTTRWFSRHRGLAVALVSAGLGVGSMTSAPIAQWLIASYDWRVAMFVLGIIALVAIIPTALLLQEPPDAMSKSVANGIGRHGGVEFTVSAALRNPQFIAIAITFFACCAAHSGPMFHTVAYAIDNGVSARSAAAILSVAGFGSLLGKIVFGLAADRLGAKPVILGGLTLQALAMSLYLGAIGRYHFYAVALAFGFAYGGVMPLYAILIRTYFGANTIGTTLGVATAASTFGMALGPLAGGWLYDGLGSYVWMFMGASAIGFGAALVATKFRPPRKL
ncbi:MAG: MFS transporter [Alphaproteobacteria bacterium]|nr:MFS transporter [Alphaproteobacteria bacterium]